MSKERYRIQGKIYYKEEEEDIKSSDRCIVDEIWKLSNRKGEQFRMMIKHGKCPRYSMYDSKGNNVLKTRSITKVEVKKDDC